MRTLRQVIIEQDLKQGKSISNAPTPKYIEAILQVSGGAFDKESMESPEKELAKEYKFKIQKDKFGQVIDQIRSLDGVTVQTKTDVKSQQAKEQVKHINPAFPEIP